MSDRYRKMIFFLMAGAILAPVFFLALNGSISETALVIMLLSAAVVSLFFLREDLALMLIIASMLLSPEISLGAVERRPVVIRFEDIFLILLAFLWMVKIAVRKDKPLIARTPLNRYLGIYSLLFIIATGKGVIVDGVNPVKGFFYMAKYLEYFVLYIVVSNFMRDKKQLKTLMAMFFFVFIIVNIYGISQIGHKPRVSAPFEGPAGEPNTLGGYQVIMTALAVGFTIHSRSFATKASMISIIGLTLAPFLYTLSRSSYLALVVMFLTMTIVASRGRRRLLVSLLVLSALTAALLPNEVRERIKDTFTAHPSEDIPVQAVFGVKVGPSASARLLSYKQVFADFIKSPVTGYGVTGKGFLDSQFVTTLLETGTLGMIGFLFMLYGVARHTLRVYRTAGDSFYKGMALGFFCAHIAMIAHAITANTFIIIRIMEPYWFIAAMLMAVPRIEAAENESLTAVQEDDAPRGIRNVELMVGKA